MTNRQGNGAPTCVECEANGHNCTAHGGRPGIPYTPENVEEPKWQTEQ